VIRGDGYEPLKLASFDIIAANPPIRAGRSVVGRFIAQAPSMLRPGGTFLLVGRIKQGVKTLARLMSEAFNRPAEELERHKGYRVLRVRKESAD